jgi:hypothetical protein
MYPRPYSNSRNHSMVFVKVTFMASKSLQHENLLHRHDLMDTNGRMYNLDNLGKGAYMPCEESIA